MPRITTSDGVGLHYLDEGAGPPVVLVAGYTAPAESWALQVPALLAAGHRVLRLDRRAHGRSDRPVFGQRMARHGKDLADFLTALDLHDVVLVGGSMGASTVWAYGDLFGAERVRAVVSVDQTPKMINDDGWSYGFYDLTRDNQGHFFDHGIPDTGRGRPRTASVQQTVRESSSEAPPMADPLAPETRWLLQDHAEQDWRDVVARLDAEILLVAARDSQLWPCEHADAAARDNPRAHSVILEDCGHAANTDRPEAFNAALLEFVGAL